MHLDIMQLPIELSIYCTSLLGNLLENYDDYFAIENFNHIETTLQDKIRFQIKDARPLTKHAISSLTAVKENEINSDMSVIELMNLKNDGKIIPYKSLYDNSIYNLTSKLYDMDIQLYSNKFGSDHLMKL